MNLGTITLTGGASLTLGLSPTLEAWLKTQDSTLNATLARIEAKLDAASALETIQMAAIDDALDTLTAQVAANTTVVGSAKVLISGFAAQLAAAIAAAQAAGATPAQLQKMTDLQVAIKTSDDELAAALVANTPVVP